MAKKSFLKDLVKIFFIVTVCLVFSVLLNFIEVYITQDKFYLIMIIEIFKIVPLMLASNFLGLMVFGAMSGFTVGTVEGLLSNLKYGSFSLGIILLNIMTGLILGLSLYPYKKSKNPLALAFVILGIFIVIIIHFYYFVYQSFFMSIFSLFYIYR